jgi:hypothetical protein
MQPASWTGLRLPIPGQAVEVFTQEFVNGAQNFLELVPLGSPCPLSGAITSLSRLGGTVVWSDSEVRCPQGDNDAAQRSRRISDIRMRYYNVSPARAQMPTNTNINIQQYCTTKRSNGLALVLCALVMHATSI